MVPRPTSPTSLLWAHQLKREHGHLLNRMKDLEKSHEAYESRIKATEVIADGMKNRASEIKEMVTRISAIEEDDKDVKEWVKKLDEERRVRMREDVERVKSLQQKLAALERQWQKSQLEAQKISSDHSMAITRIEELEHEIQRQGKSADKLSKKNDPADIKVLMRRLDAIESHRTGDSRIHRELLDKIADLEGANRQLVTKTESFRIEITRLNSEMRSRQMEVIPSSEATTEGSYGITQPSRVLVPQSPLVSSIDQGYVLISPV